MSAALHIAGPDDLNKLAALVARFHDEHKLDMTDEARLAALKPICDGIPQAVAYLIGPKAAPMGYIILSIGYSVEMGGFDCFVDELFLRPSVRGRGIGTEALLSLSKTMASADVKAMFLEVDAQDTRLVGLYKRIGFKDRERYNLMVKEL